MTSEDKGLTAPAVRCHRRQEADLDQIGPRIRSLTWTHAEGRAVSYCMVRVDRGWGDSDFTAWIRPANPGHALPGLVSDRLPSQGQQVARGVAAKAAVEDEAGEKGEQRGERDEEAHPVP